MYVVSVFLSLVINASIVLILRENVGSLFALILGGSLLLILTEIVPLMFLQERVESLISLSAPIFRKIIGFTGPVTRPLARQIEKRNMVRVDTLFTKEQLVSMLEKAPHGKESDISKEEMRMLQGGTWFF